MATQKATYQLKKLARGKKKVQTGRLENHAEASSPPPDDPVPDFPVGQTAPQDTTEPVRIKTRESARRTPSVEHHRPDLPKSEPFQTKTRGAYSRPQTTVPTVREPAIKSPVHPEHQASYSPEPGRQKFVRERVRNVSMRRAPEQRQSSPAPSGPTQEFHRFSVHGQVTTPTDVPPAYATDPDRQPVKPLEQGRQKFVQERQKEAAVQRRKKQHGPGRNAPIQQLDGENVRSGRISPPPVQKEGRAAGNAVQDTISNGKRQIKEVHAGRKAVGRTSRQAVKAADSSKQVAEAGRHSAQKIQQTARAAVQARQRAVQAASAAKRIARTVDKPVVRAVTSALRGAMSAIRGMMAPLAAGSGAVIAVVLVLCLVGALLMSPLGIFFSGEDDGTGQTISSAVRAINQEYDAKVEELKTATPHDALSLSGSRATWVEILAVYAVKTVTDPTNGQEVITMDNEKKELMRQVFWDMNELSSFTSTVPGEGDDAADTTTLHITVTTKTASEMADIYGFNTDQRQQLAELLSDEYRELWNAVLYGIGTGSGEIVAVALSQVGNVGGQPYWSWYGFSSRVNWCAIFVSWCANECGYIDAGVVPKFAGCVQGSRWFKDRGLWRDKSYMPNPGDIVFFDWDDSGGYSGAQDGVPDHVGIVERVENDRVYTVEGNSGDKCCQRSYPVGYYEIYGYGQLCP